MRLLFLLVFISVSIHSQTINLPDLKAFKNSSLDTLNHQLKLYFEDHIQTIDLKTYASTSSPITFKKDLGIVFNPLSLVLVTIQGSDYFVHSSGGMVYQIQNDTLKRIDNSFDHRMQFGSNLFTHQNKIFKYGGYGFWSARDFFTYFDNDQLEWEVYQPIQSKDIPKGTFGAYFIKEENVFHFFGGMVMNESNRHEKFVNQKVWSFDFANKTWTYKGKHELIDPDLLIVPFKNKLLLIGTNNVTKIDIENNTRTTYKHSPISAKFLGMRGCHYDNGKFYSIISTSVGSSLNLVTEEQFFGPVINETKFYRNSGFWTRRISIYLLAAIIVVIAFLWIKRSIIRLNKISLLDNGLRYRNKFTEVDPESRNILKLLLREEEVLSADILSLVEKQQYSPAHNERIKVQKIKDINIKIATLRGINKNVISSFKSSFDRRVRIYKIDKAYFRL